MDKKLTNIYRAIEHNVPDQTNPSVTILNMRNLPDGASKKDSPNPSELTYGQITINYDASKERIFFKNSANQLAVFDTTKNIFIEVDKKDESLQDQIDIINGDSTVNGSFAHADKVLENKLTPKINERVLSITGTKGIRATRDAVHNVTLETVIKSTDKILNVDNSGLTATVLATYDWNTGIIKLMGKDPNVPISQFKIQTGEKMIKAEPYIGVGNETPTPLKLGDLYIKYSFGTDGVVHETVYCHISPIMPVYNGNETNTNIVNVTKNSSTNFTITSDAKISQLANNSVKVFSDGIFVSNIHDAGVYTSTNRTLDSRIQHVRATTLNLKPIPSMLADGEIAINYRVDNERIFFKNSAGNDLAIFDTTKNTLKIVDDKITDEIWKLIDPNLASSLQYQINYEISRAKNAEKANTDKINIINGNENLEGSFAHADKILENKLVLVQDNLSDKLNKEIQRSTQADNVIDAKLDDEINRAINAENVLQSNINTISGDLFDEINRSVNKDNELQIAIGSKVKAVTGTSGITATRDINNNVLVSSVLAPNEKILTNDNKGFKTTLGMSMVDRTISLTGIDDEIIDSITLPASDALLFSGSNGVNVVNNKGTVTTSLIVDPNVNNLLTVSPKGLLALPTSKDATFIDNTGGTKLLAITSQNVIIQSASQINYIGINNSKYDVVTFYNNSALEVLFSFDNPGAGTNKFVKDYLLATLILPSHGGVEFTKAADGWHVSKIFGLTYLPDHGDTSRSDDYALIVKKDGTTTIEEVVDMKAWDESITTDLTAIELDKLYPDVPVGFQFVCYSSASIYEKANELGGWLKIKCEKL